MFSKSVLGGLRAVDKKYFLWYAFKVFP